MVDLRCAVGFLCGRLGDTLNTGPMLLLDHDEVNRGAMRQLRNCMASHEGTGMRSG